VPPAIAAAYAAFASAFPGLVAVAPFAGAAVIGLGVVASHNPERDLSHTMAGTPQATAECIQRNVASQPTRIAAVVQPLFGNQAYSVVVKRGGITGDPVMTVVIQEAGSGSTAEFRPLEPAQSDVVARLIAGC
jgi:hypothetical protein